MEISLSTNFRAFSRERESLARTLWLNLQQPLPGVFAGRAREQRCNVSTAFGSVSCAACVLCKAVSKQVTCNKKGSVFDPSDIQYFLLQKTVLEAERMCTRRRKRTIERKTWHLRTVRSLVSTLFFRYLAWSFQKEEKEGLAKDSLVKITTVLLPRGVAS